MLKFIDFVLEESEDIAEAITAAQRVKRKLGTMKRAGKLTAARKRWKGRRANLDRLKRRATRGSRLQRKRKFARGQSLKKMGAAQLAGLERRLDTKAQKVRGTKLARRLLPIKRRADLGR